jgi:zinc protease
VAKLPTVAVAIQARAGSAFDPPGRAGLATAVLETLRCGTASLDEEALAARFADLGASLGVSRGPDCVGVGTTVLARDLERALALLAEVALRPSFPLEKLERTRRELLAEKASAAARAEELLVEAFYAALYGGGHPYELPMNGTPATLAAIGREDVLRLHAERWRPESLTLAVVGDVEGARVRAAVEACLGGARAAAPLPGAGLSAAAPRPRPRLVIVDKPDQTQAHVRVGLPAIARADPDFDALALANVVLGGGGLASRITDVVRTRNGLAYSAGSVVVSRVLPAPFAAVAQTRIETAARAVELILAEVERIGTEPIPEDELSRARALFTGALPFRLETNAQKAGALLEGAAYSLGPDHLRRQIERVQALTAAEVREAARRRLRPAEMTIVAVGPREPLARELARFDGPPIAPEPAAAGAPA